MNRRTLLRLAALGTFSAATLNSSHGRSLDDSELERALRTFGARSPDSASASIVIEDGPEYSTT